MTRDDQHNSDPKVNAARIVRESTPADLEAAWLEYASQLQSVDERAMSLIRAAFEAGYVTGFPGMDRPDLQ
jgi:hypothetical protein